MLKRQKIIGSGRKQGSQNILQRELREQLQLHLANELNAIQARINELPLVDRYKVAAMLFKLLLPPQTNDDTSNAPVIIVSKDL
jgi:hypothetical protein